jgi:hypothetical protein
MTDQPSRLPSRRRPGNPTTLASASPLQPGYGFNPVQVQDQALAAGPDGFGRRRYRSENLQPEIFSKKLNNPLDALHHAAYTALQHPLGCFLHTLLW